MSLMLHLAAFISYNLGLNLPFAGISANHFGTVLFSNLESFGIHEVYVPLSSFTRNMVSISLCSPTIKVIVENDQIVKRKVANLMFNIDHRYVDGAHGPQIIKGCLSVWDNPEKFL